MTVTQSQTKPGTARLVRSAQAGGAEALDELVTAHLSLIYNIVGRALEGHADVDDVVQETMLQAIRGLPGLRDPDRFRSWLVAIAYRQIQLHLRTRSRARLRRAPEPAELADPAGDFAERTTAELVVAAQRRELVEAARWLDGPDRRLLGLWWQETAGELTRGELAAVLRVKPKHAGVRVVRMKAQLDAARGVVRALRARPRCPALAAQLSRWDGVADPLWRKRLVRHVRECAQCSRRGQGLVPPEELLLGVAALPVPVGLAAGIHLALPAKAAAASVLGHLPAFLQSKGLAVATAATVAAGGGLAYAVHYSALPATGGAVIAQPTMTTTGAATTAAPAPVASRPSASAGPAPKTKAAGTGVQSADIYVAPGGSDDGDGSVKKPYATLNKAVAVVRPGQTIALRGGTYRPAEPVTISTNGTAAKRITLSNYRDERPVVDAGAIPAGKWAITQQSSYWTVQGLEVVHSASHPYVCRACRQNVFRLLSMHDNARSGLLLRDPGTTGNQVLDSDFFDNRDPGGAAGVGLGLGIAAGDGDGNLVRGNRSAGNGGAGFDLGGFTSAVTLEYNWSYRNDGSGFVLGGGGVPSSPPHKLRHDAAWSNGSHGFADDGDPGAFQLSNNTAYHNQGTGFYLPDAPATARSNVAVDNATPMRFGAAAKQSRNSWQQDGATAATFRSADPAPAEGPRTATGLLPRTAYLVTGTGLGASMTEN